MVRLAGSVFLVDAQLAHFLPQVLAADAQGVGAALNLPLAGAERAHDEVAFTFTQPAKTIRPVQPKCLFLWWAAGFRSFGALLRRQ